MDMFLKRNAAVAEGIFGSLSTAGGTHLFATLEHAYEQPDGTYAPKLPPGTYACVRGQHQLAHMAQPFTTFEITGVPGHTNILFHVGNYNEDSEGCVLVGAVRSDNMITHSKMAFEAFMDLQSGVDQFNLTVE